MKQAVEGYLQHGFQAIKFGWGSFGSSIKKDIELVSAARGAAGNDIVLMVDAGWYGVNRNNVFKNRSIPDWRIMIKELEALNVFWLMKIAFIRKMSRVMRNWRKKPAPCG